MNSIMSQEVYLTHDGVKEILYDVISSDILTI